MLNHCESDHGHVKHVALKQTLSNYRKESIQYVSFQGSCNRIVFSQDMLDKFTIRNGDVGELWCELLATIAPDMQKSLIGRNIMMSHALLSLNFMEYLYLHPDDHDTSSFLCPWLSFYERLKLHAASSFLSYELK